VDVKSKLEEVRTRIERAGGDPSAVEVVAVTKGFDAEACRAAIDAGVCDLGESYAQEAIAKITDVGKKVGARWHFIGRVQTNKVRVLGPLVSLWQSVDRDTLLDELGRRSPGARILIQVNISDEPQKGGCAPGDVGRLVSSAEGAGLDVAGLMGIGPDGDPQSARPAFRLLRSLADDMGLAVRSMGMSADLEVAVEEGSTMVRVGTGLFGPRRSTDLPRD
jgi:pyridoxal phosphate enzyme (YggS family)